MSIVQSSRKAEGLEAGIGVGDNAAELVVVEFLNDIAGGNINEQARAAEVVGNDAIGVPAFDQVIRNVSASAVDKTADDIIIAV